MANHIKADDAGFLRAVTIDECPDANGNWTMRFADGTPNGNTEEEPLATFYNLETAKHFVAMNNGMGKLMQLQEDGKL